MEGPGVKESMMGSSTDMANAGVRRLMVNAVYHLLDMDVPAKAEVGLIGAYQPSPYGFKDDEYWEQKNLKVADYVVDDHDD